MTMFMVNQSKSLAIDAKNWKRLNLLFGNVKRLAGVNNGKC
jgi:hypothetical protein